jgi:hypothetical protein
MLVSRGAFPKYSGPSDRGELRRLPSVSVQHDLCRIEINTRGCKRPRHFVQCPSPLNVGSHPDVKTSKDWIKNEMNFKDTLAYILLQKGEFQGSANLYADVVNA